MAVNKLHREFFTLDMASGWETPEGQPPGVQQKILSGALDETAGRGSQTRLLRFAPGTHTTAQVWHNYWEEVYVMSGEFIVAGETFPPNTYACRPPHAVHGPFGSETGCLLLEFGYYDPA
jgi:hypothetical protein